MINRFTEKSENLFGQRNNISKLNIHTFHLDFRGKMGKIPEIVADEKIILIVFK